VAVGYIPKAIAVNPVTNKIYAVNAGDSTVSVIDGATSTVTDTVTVGSISDSYGTAVAVNPVTNKIYVAGSFAGTVTVIDGATDATTTVTVGSIPKGIAVNPVTNKIYVVDEGSMGTSTVSVIDGATNTVTDTVTVATISVSYGSAVAVNPVTNRIYVTGSFAGAVTVIDGATDATTTVNVGSIPKAIAVNPVTNKIYVVNANDSTVSVINGCCNSVGAIVPVATISESYGTDVTVNLATDKIYVTGSFSNNVTEIDGATNTTATLAVGLTPTAIATNLATSYIYPVNAQASTVSPIAEDQFQPIPFTTTIAPLPGNVSTTSTPTFTFTASSAFAPIAPPVQNVYFQLDTLEGPWIAATPGAGNYTATSAPLQQGTHVVYAYATDGQDADFAENSQHLIGRIAAEVFTVILPGSNTLLTADHNPAGLGQSVTFTADVSSGGAGTLTGTVTFFDGATSLGSDAVASGTATLATSALSLGSHSITAVYSGDGNFSPSTSTVLTEVIAVSNPVPVETSLSVNSAIAGGAGFTLTVNGSNFVAGSVVEWNGAALATTFVGAAQVTAVVPGGDLAVAGTVAVTVFNSAPGGGASSALTFTINNPIAVQTSISPTFATLGGAGFTLTVNGSNFLSGSVVRWNGVALATTFLSGTQLTAAVPAGDLASAAAASITVFNSTPGGGASNALTLTINNPVPAQTSLSPNSVSVGGASFTLTVNGANFVSGSVVRWNGVALATTFLSGTQLTAAVPAGDLASATTASITVFNSTPGGGASNTLTETVALTATSTTLTASPNPVVVGQPVTFTVTVSPAPTGSTLGTVSFFSGSTLLGTRTVNSSGVATFVTSGLSVGPGNITAVYSGNALFATSTSVGLTETVAPLTVTTTTLVASPNPVVVGQPVTFSVTVSPAPTGSTLGTVSFFSGPTLLDTGTVNSSGVATFVTSGLSVGPRSITAVYSGNALFATSTSVGLTETVAPLTVTSTTLAASPNPVVVGQPVTFTVSVSPAPTGSTLGTVSFFSGSTLLGMGTVNSSGVATFATSGLSVGAGNITAVYSGNALFATSTSVALTETVAPKTVTSTTLGASPNPVVVGQPVTFTVTVSPAPTGSTLGTVSFFSGATLLGMGTVNSSGVATYATSGLPVGTDAVTGIYSGNASFAASTSETANVTVTASQIAAVTVNFNPTSPVYGQVTTITVAETAGGLAVAGATATVTIGGHSYTCATNSSGQCVVTLPGGVLGGGSDSVTVATSATPNAAAGLFTFAVTVGLAPTTLALSSSSTEITAGNPVTLTATVASAPPGTPTGMVTFYSNGTSIGTGILAGGVASLPLSTLATGANSISATYAGDANFLGSTATGFTQTALVNFTITAGSGSTPPTQTTPPGGTAVFPLSLGIINGFVGPVTMSATGLPPGATATFNPPIFNLDGVHPGTTVMSVVTAPANAQALPAQGPGPGSRSPISYGLLLLPLLAVGGILRRLRAAPLLLAALGVLSLGVATAALSGCGNGGYFGAAPASYVITVTGTSGALHHSTTVTLTIQ
jgi:YVTN family beta-propeller protein